MFHSGTLQTPRRFLPIVDRARLAAARTARPAVLARTDFHFERQLRGIFHPADLCVNNGLERFDAIEDSFQLPPGAASQGQSVTTLSLTGRRPGGTSFAGLRTRYTGLVRRNGVGLCWRATRPGIAASGRVNEPAGAPAVHHRRGSLLTPHSSALQDLRKRNLNLPTSSTFTHRFCALPGFKWVWVGGLGDHNGSR